MDIHYHHFYARYAIVEFEKHFNGIKNLVLKERQRTAGDKRCVLDTGLFDAILDDAGNSLFAAPIKALRGADSYESIELTPGYKKYLEDLEALSR